MGKLTLQDWCTANNREDLLIEWDYAKNDDIKTDVIMPLSNKKVWWKCKYNHEWEATPNNRTKGAGCPYCSGRYAVTGENDLQTLYPELAEEWHPTKNGELKPSSTKAASGRKIWWKCANGHEWQAVVRSRSIEKCGCPYCAGIKAVSGVNDLQTAYPIVAAEWHPTKNGDLKPSNVKPLSAKKVWWRCSKGHEWQAIIYSRTNGCGCPVCSNHKLLVGYNDLETTFPDLAKEWHPTKNGDLKPEDVTYGNTQRVWWKCGKGHEWQAVISERVSRGIGCPYCSGRYAIPGENDLQTVNPELAREWHPTKNGDLLPSDVKIMSNKKVWWICDKGHEWQVSPGSRVFQKTGCPICSNKRILVGYNDLATTHPELAKEWNYERNHNLKPTSVTYGYSYSVWWKCKYGHEWYTSPNARTSSETGCPFCSGKGSSLPEQGISFYLESICLVERRARIMGREIDVLLPEYKIGIEYDGMFFHPLSNIEKEKAKDESLLKTGYRVIRVKESDINIVNKSVILYKADSMRSNYEWALKELCRMLSDISGDAKFNAIEINVQRDMSKIRERLDLFYKDNSLVVTNPDLAEEWNYEKNGILKPEMVYSKSNKSVWWIGKCGHEWRTSPNNRMNGRKCPYCSGQKAKDGFNDLQTFYPHIAKEWNYEKNKGRIDEKGRDISTPNKVSTVSGLTVWWKCSRGHEWQTRVSERTKRGEGCPYCSGRKVIIGETDLETLFPEIAKEWDCDRNGELRPSDVKPNYNKPIWWKCSVGHEWKTTPNSRVSNKTGCPFCFRIRVGKRVKNIETGHFFDNPRLAAASCGLKSGNGVAQCCRGKRTTSGGYHWEFVNDDKSIHNGS